MKSFEYATPQSLDQATGLLADHWGETEILAGGTDLVTCLKQYLTAPKRLVSLKALGELKEIRQDDHSLRIGAMASLETLALHPLVKKQLPAVRTAILNIGSPQLLAQGTVGGELCQRPRCWFYRNGFGLFGMDNGVPLVRQGDNRYHAIFGNDGPALFVSASSLGPVLVALDASLTVVGPGNKKRNIAAADFFTIPKNESERETALRPNEILTEIEVRLKGYRNATYEVRHRKGLDWPYVTATVAFRHSGNQAADARVVLGHVAPKPWPSPQAAKVLNGNSIDDSLAGRCGDAAAQGAQPLSRNGYKIQLVKTAVKRAVLAAAQS